MENQLIPYKVNESGEVIVSGRELHDFLQIKTPFKIWIPRMIEYGFEEKEDYEIVIQKYQTSGGMQDFKDYMLKADMAKEICMFQRSDRGRQARLYFINLEKKFNSPEAILDRLRQLLDYNTSYSQSSDEEIIHSSQVVSQVIPSNPNITNQLVPSYMADNYNSENFSDLLTNFRDTAKMFGMKENMLISWLILRNFCYRDNYNSIRPYSQYMEYFNLRPFKSPAGHSGIQALINSRGRDYFTNLLMNENLMKVEYTDVL